MSDGELKKKIALADGETRRWNEGYRTFVAKDTVDNILDEAKVDFPLQDTDDVTGHDIGYRTRDIDAWLKKWFGEQK